MTAVHPRVAVSQISSWTWSVAEDLAFYRDAGIHTVGVALRKLDEPGTADQLAEAGLAWSDVIGVGSRRVAEGLALAARLGAPMVVLTTGPAGPVPWEAAADRFAETMGPLVDQARTAGVGLTLEHTNSLRADVGFVHTLRDAIDLARARRPRGLRRGQRLLGRAGPGGHHRRRHRPHPPGPGQRLRHRDDLHP